MLFVLFIDLILSIQHPLISTDKAYFLDSQESECIYDRVYSTSIFSNSVICLIRCKFISIKSASDGGAVVISLRNRFGTQSKIDKCSFINCSSQTGAAIYLNIEENISMEIVNSEFMQNSATSSNGGAINILANTKNNIYINNCTFNKNYAYNSGGAIYISSINYLIDKCKFLNNNIKYYDGGAIYSKNTYGNFKNNLFSNNYLSDGFAYDGNHGGAVSFVKSNISFSKCQFINNILNGEKVYGGAISIYFSLDSDINSIGLFEECTFINNTACSKYSSYNSYGGAILFDFSYKQTRCYLNSNVIISNSVFSNNTAISKLYHYNDRSGISFGGAISFKTSLTFSYVALNVLYQNLTFTNNTAYSMRSSSYGGAISFYDTTSHSHYSSFKLDCTIKKSTFINNTAFSNTSIAQGGAIKCYCPNQSIKHNLICLLSDSTFTNNTAFSNSSYAEGGAIQVFQIYGTLQNCTFNSNNAKTYLKTFLITGNEPRSLGGAVYSKSANFDIIDCTFINNIGFGNSPLHVSTGKGGALYATNSSISIRKSTFKNNTLYNMGLKFDIDCYIEGGACYFSSTNANLNDCSFINNTATLCASENSIYFSARIYGGAIYSHSINRTVKCTNCVFTDNLVLVPNHKEKEFGGAIYLNNGTLDNCIFNGNAAYNGGDIRYDQKINSVLKVTKCSFKHGIDNSHEIKSLIHFRVSESKSSVNVFTDNIVVSEIWSYVFDGELEESNGILKFQFSGNCMSPFNEEFYKSGDLTIYKAQVILAPVPFESAFASACSESVISRTISVATPTVKSKTPAPTENIITPTENIITRTQTIPSATQTQAKPIATPTAKPKTRTPTQTPTIHIITPTENIITRTQTRPVISQIPTIPVVTQTEKIKTQTQTQAVLIITSTPNIKTQTVTQTIPVVTQTKDIITQTQSISPSVTTREVPVVTSPPDKSDSSNSDDKSKSKISDDIKFFIILVLLICILSVQLIIFLIFIVTLVFRFINRKNGNDLINPLIDLA